MLIKEKAPNNSQRNGRENNVTRKVTEQMNMTDVERFQQHRTSDPLQLHCTFVWWTAFSIIATVLTITGYWLPFWLHGNYHDIDVSFGPFSNCNYPMIDKNGKLKVSKKCFRYESFNEIPSLSGQVSYFVKKKHSCN